MDQQGSAQYAVRPVQKHDRPTDTLDPQTRTRFTVGTHRSKMPPPNNYYGRKKFRPPPPESRSYVPAGLSGVYKYNGPVLPPYGIEKKFQI